MVPIHFDRYHYGDFVSVHEGTKKARGAPCRVDAVMWEATITDSQAMVQAALRRDAAALRESGVVDDPRLRPEYLWMRARRPSLAPLAVLVHDEARHLAGVVYAVEECVRGVRAGLLRLGDACGAGLAVVRPDAGPQVLPVALRQLARLHRVHGLVINTPLDAGYAGDAAASLPYAEVQRATYVSKSRIALPASLDALLARLGPNHRRNLRRYPAHATRAGIRYVGSLDVPAFQAAFDAVRARCDRWNGIDPNPALIDAPRTVRAGLRSATDEWLSVVAGWQHGDRAFIAAQLNHAGFPTASLSAVLRVWVIERLIADGVREIVFLGGCAGTLRAVCTPDPVIRTLVELRTPRGRVAKWMAQSLSPALARRLWPVDLNLAPDPDDPLD